VGIFAQPVGRVRPDCAVKGGRLARQQGRGGDIDILPDQGRQSRLQGGDAAEVGAGRVDDDLAAPVVVGEAEIDQGIGHAVAEIVDDGHLDGQGRGFARNSILVFSLHHLELPGTLPGGISDEAGCEG